MAKTGAQVGDDRSEIKRDVYNNCFHLYTSTLAILNAFPRCLCQADQGITSARAYILVRPFPHPCSLIHLLATPAGLASFVLRTQIAYIVYRRRTPTFTLYPFTPFPRRSIDIRRSQIPSRQRPLLFARSSRPKPSSGVLLKRSSSRGSTLANATSPRRHVAPSALRWRF